MDSNERQRKEDERREARAFAWSGLFFLGCLLIIATCAGTTGCSSLQENVTACMNLGRGTAYTVNGRAETFNCEARR